MHIYIVISKRFRDIKPAYIFHMFEIVQILLSWLVCSLKVYQITSTAVVLYVITGGVKIGRGQKLDGKSSRRKFWLQTVKSFS